MTVLDSSRGQTIKLIQGKPVGSGRELYTALTALATDAVNKLTNEHAERLQMLLKKYYKPFGVAKEECGRIPLGQYRTNSEEIACQSTINEVP